MGSAGPARDPDPRRVAGGARSLPAGAGSDSAGHPRRGFARGPSHAPDLPHGGRDAWGWKVDGRWVCYYHPGDIGDAWSDEHAGVKPEIAEYCYQLGTNVIFYAYMEYSKWLAARRQRK